MLARQRLLDHEHAGVREGGSERVQPVQRPAAIHVDEQRHVGKHRANGMHAIEVVLAAQLQLDHRGIAKPGGPGRRVVGEESRSSRRRRLCSALRGRSGPRSTAARAWPRDPTTRSPTHFAPSGPAGPAAGWCGPVRSARDGERRFRSPAAPTPASDRKSTWGSIRRGRPRLHVPREPGSPRWKRWCRTPPGRFPSAEAASSRPIASQTRPRPLCRKCKLAMVILHFKQKALALASSQSDCIPAHRSAVNISVSNGRSLAMGLDNRSRAIRPAAHWLRQCCATRLRPCRANRRFPARPAIAVRNK